jgi:hypothetical protein
MAGFLESSMTPLEYVAIVAGCIAAIVLICELLAWRRYKPVEEVCDLFPDSEISAAVRYADYLLRVKKGEHAPQTEESTSAISTD